MTTPTSIDRLVCGCSPMHDHQPGCVLGLAETIAAEAHDQAVDDGGHRLLTILTALAEAGLLLDLPADQPMTTIEGLLDALWGFELLGPMAAVST